MNNFKSVLKISLLDETELTTPGADVDSRVAVEHVTGRALTHALLSSGGSEGGTLQLGALVGGDTAVVVKLLEK